jgi:hypothetical protein
MADLIPQDARGKMDMKAVKQAFKANKWRAQRSKQRFLFRDGDKAFTCNLMKLRCCALKRDGSRCTRSVVNGLFNCFQHTQSVFSVRVDKSGIGDFQGLFACDARKPENAILFRKSDYIVPYLGEVLTKQQLDNRYGTGDATAPYAVTAASNGKIYDSACFMGIGAKTNHDKQQANTEIHPNGQCLVAKKGIKNGAEILVDYGDDYDFKPLHKIRPKQNCRKKKRKCFK